tara:strand:- start:232 stop:717 length:486 start_codon:yes stop_codon:yes gene_type:complete
MKLQFDDNGTLVSEKPKTKSSNDSFQAEQGLGGLNKLKIGSGKNSIPLGESLLGGGASILTSELIDGIVPSNLGGGYAGPIIRLVAGIFVLNMMKPIIGQGSSDIGKAFITFDSIRDLIPVDNFISGITGNLKMNAGNPPVPVSAYAGSNPQAELNAWLSS